MLLLLGGAVALLGFVAGWWVLAAAIPTYLGLAIWRLYPKPPAERAAKIVAVATLYLVGVITVMVATLVIAFWTL